MAFTKLTAALVFCTMALALAVQGEAACPGLTNAYASSNKVKLTAVNPGFLNIKDITLAGCETNCNTRCNCKSYTFERRTTPLGKLFRLCTLYGRPVTFKPSPFSMTHAIRKVPVVPKCPVVKPLGACTANSTFAVRITKTGCGVSDISTITYVGEAKSAAGAVVAFGPLPPNASFIGQTCSVNNLNCNVCEAPGQRELTVSVSKAKFFTIIVKIKGPRSCVNVPGRIVTTCGPVNLNA